jgi:hypothetical protein
MLPHCLDNRLTDGGKVVNRTCRIKLNVIIVNIHKRRDRLCGLVVRVPGYRSRGPGSIPGATTFSVK